MKILFWTDGFWPRIGGIETQGLHLMKGLQKKGHSCLVLAQKDNPNWKEDDEIESIPIRRFDFNSVIVQRNLQTVSALEQTLASIVSDFQPDLIHLNACVGPTAFIFLLLRKMLPPPLILTVHSTYSHDESHRPLIGRIASLSHQIGCVSRCILHEMQTYFPHLSCKLVYNGAAVSPIAPAPLPFSPPTLLCLGRFSSEKGFDIAIQAFSLLKQTGSDAQLLLVGDGPEYPALERLVQELGLTDCTRFLGAVEQKQAPQWINQATLVLIPSFLESFGLVAVEAMQMQRPVIASRTGGLTEIITEGETGLFVPAKDPVSLCRAIQHLLAHPLQAIQMGLNGRKRALETFSLDQMVSQYETLYRESL